MLLLFFALIVALLNGYNCSSAQTSSNEVSLQNLPFEKLNNIVPLSDSEGTKNFLMADTRSRILTCAEKLYLAKKVGLLKETKKGLEGDFHCMTICIRWLEEVTGNSPVFGDYVPNIPFWFTVPQDAYLTNLTGSCHTAFGLFRDR